MDTINVFLTVAMGLLLRLGVPVAITILMIGLLRWFDQRWQRDAKFIPLARSSGKPCWEVKNCSAENKSKCPACANSSSPCWQYFRSKNGVLQERCVGCEVFRMAPVPATSR